MIICYAGLPGAGKSYSVVENVIIPGLLAKRHVAHNLELCIEGLAESIGFDPTPYLHQFDRDDSPEHLIESCPLGAIIVIDEVWRYWPGGMKVNAVPKEQVKFFKEHRHRVGDDGIASEVVIIDQDPQTGFPAFIRALVDETYLHSKLDKVGMKDRFRVDIYRRCQSAEKPSAKAHLREMYGRYKPEVFRCYQSHTQSTRPDEAGLELAADGRANILKSGTVKAAIAAMFLMPFLLWASFDRFMAIAPKKEPVITTHQGVFQQSPIVTDAQPAKYQPELNYPEPEEIPDIPELIYEPDPEQVAKLPKLSARWRLVGLMFKTSTTEGMAYLASIGGFRRIPIEYCDVDVVGDWRCGVEDGFATFYSAVVATNPMSAKRVEGGTDANVPMKGQTEKL